MTTTWTKTTGGNSSTASIGVGGQVGTSIVAAASITLDEFVTTISGSLAIDTINGMVSGRVYIVVPAAGSTWTISTAGNVTQAVSAVAGVPVLLLRHGSSIRVVSDATFSASAVPVGTTTATAFGDSITAGFVSSSLDPANAYATAVAAGRTWTLTNSGVASTLLQDAGQMDAIMGVSTGTASNYFMLSGYNDMRSGGTTAANKATYQDALYSAVAWLAIPDVHKVKALGTSVAYSGAWSPATVHGAKYTTTNGDSATMTLYGSTIYVVSERVNGQTGTFTLTVDGVSFGTFNCFGNTISPSSRAYCPFLIRITNLTDKAHTVVLAKSGGDVVYFNWAAGASGSLTSNGPNVFVGNCLRMSAAGYALGSPNYSNGSDTAAYQYNKIIRDVTREFAIDGLNVVYVDASSYYSPAIDVGGDNIHPSIAGHAKIANAFLAQMLGTVQGKDRGGADKSGVVVYQAYGENPARVGTVRLPTAEKIAWRNNANTADGPSLTSDSSDRLVSSAPIVLNSQPAGIWATPAFAAGDFTANGSLTWTLAAGDVGTYEYTIVEKKMTVNWELLTTTSGGVTNNTLQIKIPAGKVAAKNTYGWMMWTETNGAPFTLGFCKVAAGGTNILIFKIGITNWGLVTDLLSVYGTITFEIQ